MSNALALYVAIGGVVVNIGLLLIQCWRFKRELKLRFAELEKTKVDEG